MADKYESSMCVSSKNNIFIQWGFTIENCILVLY